MVTLCITRVATVALLAILAHPSHARWNVYSTFVDRESESHPLSSKSYDVGNTGCFSLPGANSSTRVFVQFSKNAANSQHRANGPYCLHFYKDRCTKDDMEGNDMWQYQNVHLTGKTLYNSIYTYDVGCTNQTAAFKWTPGPCSNPSETIDDKEGHKAYVTESILAPPFRRSVRPNST